jgi:hypothetical protein
MKTIAILLTSLSLTAASRPSVSTVRSNYVYTFAAQACPKAHELNARLKRDVLPEFLTRIAKDAHMTNDESSLLVLMCFMYDRGTRHDDGVLG